MTPPIDPLHTPLASWTIDRHNNPYLTLKDHYSKPPDEPLKFNHLHNILYSHTILSLFKLPIISFRYQLPTYYLHCHIIIYIFLGLLIFDLLRSLSPSRLILIMPSAIKTRLWIVSSTGWKWKYWQ